ncbi:MAG: ribonuclease III [Negativicutes bacterium]|nr:ribonuclease III [Negativicutes bacterium]
MDLHPESQKISALGRKLGVTFSDSGLLRQALTHTSFANEAKGETIPNNERLEFLGDAVLDLIVSEYLYRQYSHLPEGELTKARAAIVCEQALANQAIAIRLGESLLLGRGEAASGGRERVSILADAFEAVIGAIYLDGGYAAARQFILSHLQQGLASIERGEYAKDYKTLLQEIAQRSGDCKISYEVIAESGPDHHKTFEVAVFVNGGRQGTGTGRSKKEAEQRAALEALHQFHPLEI